MDTFIGWDDKKYRAWSIMTCNDFSLKKEQEHKPHVWDADYMCYGPYFCPGKIDPDKMNGEI